MSYIKLYRQLEDHWIWDSPKYLRAWLYILIKANYKDSKVMRGNVLIDVKRGQLFTSKLALAAEWKMHRETVSSFLACLKADKMIDIQTSNRTDTGYTLITICNYDKYQGFDKSNSDSQPDSQPTLEPTVNRQSVYTSNKTKEYKEVKEKSIAVPVNGTGRKDEAYEYFACEFKKHRGIPYQNKEGDFVRLARLRKTLGAEPKSTFGDWERSVGNYFASVLGAYTLADLCNRFDVFRLNAVDRYGKPDVPEEDYFTKLRREMNARGK